MGVLDLVKVFDKQVAAPGFIPQQRLYLGKRRFFQLTPFWLGRLPRKPLAERHRRSSQFLCSALLKPRLRPSRNMASSLGGSVLEIAGNDAFGGHVSEVKQACLSEKRQAGLKY
ncbi:MAG: hypothetical protein Tsb0019_03110 [Roseibium sp.]